MASVLTRLKDKVSTSTSTAAISLSPAGRSSKRKESLSTRVIPPEPVQAQPEGVIDSGEAEPALQIHNLARANKNVPKLEWDERLARDADEYAKMLATTGKLEHSSNEVQGENLFMSSKADATYEDAVSAWMNEEKQYNGEAIGEGNSAEYGHFTQCLWHSTTHVGMGKKTAKDGKTFIVARYSPRGNVMGKKPFAP